MAFNLTENAELAVQQTLVEPNLVLAIDGYPFMFGSVEIYRYIRIGDPDLYIDDSWVIGGFRLVANQHPWITFDNGTTTKISQKLDTSRAQGSSVSQMVISLVDVNFEVSKLVSPGVVLDEILGRKVTVYSGFIGTGFPEDYVIIFRGVIQSYEVGAGFVNLIINSTEEKKRKNVTSKVSTKLSQTFDYQSATIQDLFYKNQDDNNATMTIVYAPGGTNGSESIVIGVGTITIYIENGVSTANNIKKAIMNHDTASLLVDVKVEGNGTSAQVIGSWILEIDTTALVDDTSEFYLPADSGTLRTYFKIKEELCEYTSKTLTSFIGITRTILNTTAISNPIDSDMHQILRLFGNGMDIALKFMLSQGPTYFREGIEVENFVYVNVYNSISNAIIFRVHDVQEIFGLVPGDMVTITGAGIGGNNVVNAVIIDYGNINDVSYIIIDQLLSTEVGTPAVAKFKSKYNVLPIGLGMTPDEVDVLQHEFIRDTFVPAFNLDIYFSETGNGRDFIEKEIYLPMACFSVPRKGRSSVSFHTGPIASYDVITLDNSNVKNPQALKIQRSISENYFNELQYDFDYNPVTEKFDSTLIFKDTEAANLTGLGFRSLKIQAKGLRTESGAVANITETQSRFLDRYSLGADFIKSIKLKGGKAFKMEIGDVSLVDFGDLQLTDLKTGTKNSTIKVMEVINKVVDNKTGEIALDVVNTVYKSYERYGFIAPASMTTTGSNTTKLMLQKKWGTKSYQTENWKWKEFIGQHVIVRTADFSQIYQTTLRDFDISGLIIGMIVDPIPVAPGNGWIIEPPNYAVPNKSDEAVWKLRTVFLNPTLKVVSGSSQTQFTVSVLDASFLFIGSIIRMHNYAYTQDSPEVEVLDIVGVAITVSEPLGFLPNNSHYINLIGFTDEQPAYRIL